MSSLDNSITFTTKNINNIGKKSYAFIPSHETFSDILKSSIAESVAYFFLVICIFFSEGELTKFIFGFWSILMVFGNISGAHINPIVTFALWIYNGDLFTKPHLLKLFLYITFQIIGAILATTFCYLVYSSHVSYVSIPKNTNFGKIFFTESFFGGTLAFIILFICSPTTRPTTKNYVNITLLSVWLILINAAGSKISGASYNPTFYLVLNGFAYFFNNQKNAYDYIAVYILAPFVGAFIFTLLFRFLYKPFYASRNKKETIDE